MVNLECLKIVFSIISLVQQLELCFCYSSSLLLSNASIAYISCVLLLVFFFSVNLRQYNEMLEDARRKVLVGCLLVENVEMIQITLERDVFLNRDFVKKTE